MKLSALDIKNIFFELEKDKTFLSFKLRGISLYFILRFQLEMHIRTSKSSQFSNKPNNIVIRGIRKINRILFGPPKLESITHLFDSPDSLLESPFLFVGTCALRNEEGSNVDLYDIIKHYYKKNLAINFIQPEYKRRPFPKKSKYYHTFVKLEESSNYLSDDEKSILSDFVDYLSSKIGVDLSSKKSSYLSSASITLSRAKNLEELIVKSKPKFVFARSVYTEPWVPIACKASNTQLIEVQHGALGIHCLYYQTSLGEKDLKMGHILMPSYILTIGEEWKKILIDQRSYFDINNVFNIGTSNIGQISKLQNNKKKRVLFLLQGRRFNGLFTITNFLLQFLQKYASEIIKKDVEIVVRPHPVDKAEAELFLEEYGDYIHIEDPHSISSMDSIKKSNFIMSATSMCLYEALALGITAISLKPYTGVIATTRGIEFIDSIEELFDLVINSNGNIDSFRYLDEFDYKPLDYFYEQIEALN